MITDTKQLIVSLLDEVAHADPAMFSPVHPIEQDETVILTIDDEDVKRIFVLEMMYARERALGEATLKFEPDDNGKRAEHRRTDNKCDLYHELFWYAVRERYELWTEPGLGVRKGWRVVRTRQDDGPRRIISALFGGV